MYVTFIVIFLVVRNIMTRARYSRIEYLMNAIHELEEVAHLDLDAEEKEKVLKYLEKCDPNDPLVSELKGMLDKIARLRAELDRKGLAAELEVDGGINAEVAPRVVRAGARVLVAGAAVFTSGQTVVEALGKIRASLG